MGLRDSQPEDKYCKKKTGFEDFPFPTIHPFNSDVIGFGEHPQLVNRCCSLERESIYAYVMLPMNKTNMQYVKKEKQKE